MSTSKITDRSVREITPPPRGQKIVRDSEMPGFAVRITATGCTSFVLNYVSAGRERRITIGRYPTWSVASARDQARRLRRDVDVGVDPLERREYARSEPTLQDLWDRYAEGALPLKAASTQRNERSIWLRLVLPELGRRRLSTIDGSDVDRLLVSVGTKTPYQANRCRASLRRAFAIAIRWGLTQQNPVSGSVRFHEDGRARYLNDLERARLAAALRCRLDKSAALAIYFLLLTGARCGEVFKASWEHIDLEEKVWVKPSAHTKQRRLHRVPLSEGALAVLIRARALGEGTVVFPNRIGKPFTSVKKTFRVLCREAGLHDFRLHDLRHSYASFAASEGASLPIIGRLLGHTQASTTNRYSHLDDAALRVMTNLVSDRVTG